MYVVIFVKPGLKKCTPFKCAIIMKLKCLSGLETQHTPISNWLLLNVPKDVRVSLQTLVLQHAILSS